MKRVLVTGAGGYIGQHMLDQLVAREYQVHAVSRSTERNSNGVIWHSVNLMDAAATDVLLKKIDATHLVHLAWVTDPGVYWQSPLNADWLHASTRLVQCFVRHGGTRAVLAGTCAEYDWSDGHCVEDETPLRAKSPYTRNKLAFRDAALELVKTGGLQMAWARVFFLFGADERPERLVPTVIRSLLAGQRAECSDASLLRDFLYVMDVAAAMVAVLDHDYCGDINIASGKALSLEDLVMVIARKLNAENRVDFGCYPRRPDDPERITADTARLNDLIGWSPRYDLDSAIEHTIAWWRNGLPVISKNGV